MGELLESGPKKATLAGWFGDFAPAPWEAQSEIQRVKLAFQQWRAVWTQAVAQNYVLSSLA